VLAAMSSTLLRIASAEVREFESSLIFPGGMTIPYISDSVEID
jgi:hypothetical protein